MPMQRATDPSPWVIGWWGSSPPADHGHCAGLSLAMGYLDADIAIAGEGLRVSVLEEPRPYPRPHSPLDPDGKRMRS
ncbi:MAG: hypothetical protein U1F35_16000 [Steroidobacteraceae bacterium]